MLEEIFQKLVVIKSIIHDKSFFALGNGRVASVVEYRTILRCK